MQIHPIKMHNKTINYSIPHLLYTSSTNAVSILKIDFAKLQTHKRRKNKKTKKQKKKKRKKKKGKKKEGTSSRRPSLTEDQDNPLNGYMKDMKQDQ